MDDSSEVERLRARVHQLEGELEEGRNGSPVTSPERQRSAWYAVGSAVLLVVACLLAPLSVTAVWASTQVSDTEQYVQTVAPLANDPAVQAAVANEITEAVLGYLDVEAVTREALSTLAAQENVPPRVGAVLPGLAVPIANGVESFTRTQVTRLVQSPQFAELWAQVNRVAHEQLVTLLEGNEGGAVSAQGRVPGYTGSSAREPLTSTAYHSSAAGCSVTRCSTLGIPLGIFVKASRPISFCPPKSNGAWSVATVLITRLRTASHRYG